MRHFILLFILLAHSFLAIGQLTYCNGNNLGIQIIPIPDTTQGNNPQLGITLDAYNNCNYSYDFKFFVGDSLDITGVGLTPLTSIEMVAISGAPNGLNFQCDPPTCLFTPNTVNSVTISGIPNDTPNDYLVILQTEFITPVIPVPVALDFPNPTLAPGEYRMTLNASPPSCSSCAGFTVQVNKTDDLCDAGNGSINFVPSGGTPPYNYSVCATNTSNTTISGLSSGIYLVQIVDAVGCKLTETVEILGSSSINTTTTNETCLLNDGTATISAFGSSFTYLWNTGATTQTIAGLNTGYYASTTTDIINSCIKIDTVFVAQDSTCLVYFDGQVVIDDVNPDCTIDQTSRYPNNKLVYAFKNGQLAAMNNTDALGNYTFTLDTGTYVIRVASGPYDIFSCPAADSVVVNALVPNSSYQEDFYLTLTPHQDLCVDYLNGPARPGFDQWHSISYCNYGTDSISGSVTLVHDSILTAFDANGTEDSYDPVTFTAIWSFTNLAPGECGTIRFETVTPVGTPLGEILANTVTIDPQANDIDLENNSMTLANIVTGSYDPNDKQNLIADSTFSGPVYIGDDQFHYFIRFQNTGTDTAFTVVVKDELEPNLDITTLQPLAASHAYNLTIEDERTLVFTFNNILLVDSVTNEPASHGFLSFKIDLVDNLPLGTVIENQAGIYFDFNPPIITNMVVNTISEPLSVVDAPVFFSSTVFPNPTDASAMLNLSLTQTDRASVELVDITGKRYGMPVRDALYTKGEHLIPLDLEGIPNGLLIVRITVGGEEQSLKLVKMD